jgi:hypothetical protein
MDKIRDTKFYLLENYLIDSNFEITSSAKNGVPRKENMLSDGQKLNCTCFRLIDVDCFKTASSAV